MDHSARRSMKNAANCVKHGELQGSRNRNMSNAYGASNIAMLGARLSEGLLKTLIIFGESFISSKVSEFTPHVWRCSPGCGKFLSASQEREPDIESLRGLGSCRL